MSRSLYLLLSVALLTACSNPDRDYELAFQSDSVKGYESLLDKYPEHPRAEEARTRLDKLREALAWQAAIAPESIDALESFASQYPSSIHKSEVQQRLWKLRLQQYIDMFRADDVVQLKTLDQGALLEALREDGQRSPLLFAASLGSAKIAKYLIEAGADVNERRDDQATALHLAARSGALRIAKLLVSNGADIDATIERQVSFVRIAPTGERTWHAPPPTAKTGTPLHWAALYDHPAVATFLLESGADVNADDGDGSKPIHFAAHAGNMALIRVLEDAGTDWRPSKRGYNRRVSGTPLHYAATVEVADYFLKKGLATDLDSEMGMPLHAAANFGHTEVVEFLLDRGADVDAECFLNFGGGGYSFRVTPLWVAAHAGKNDVIELLAAKGGDLRYRTLRGASLLHAAAKNGWTATVTMLLESGLPIDERADVQHVVAANGDWNEITPLGVAVHYGHLDTVTMLVDEGADVNAAFANTWNPLSVATVSRHREIVEYLIGKKAHLGENDHIERWDTTDEIQAVLREHFRKEPDS